MADTSIEFSGPDGERLVLKGIDLQELHAVLSQRPSEQSEGDVEIRSAGLGCGFGCTAAGLLCGSRCQMK